MSDVGRRLARAHAEMQRARGRPVTPAEARSWEASQAEPIRRPPAGAPRRPIDDMTDDGYVRGASYRIEAGAVLRYEVDECPSWMQPQTYRWLLARLAQGMHETPTKELDALHAWTARHVWVVSAPPKIVSDGGAYDLIGPALGILREAKRRGMDPRELGAERRRRLI